MVFTVRIADGRSKIAPGRPGAIRGVPGTPPGRSNERPGGSESVLGTARALPERSRDAPGSAENARNRSGRAPKTLVETMCVVERLRNVGRSILDTFRAKLRRLDVHETPLAVLFRAH